MRRRGERGREFSNQKRAHGQLKKKRRGPENRVGGTGDGKENDQFPEPGANHCVERKKGKGHGRGMFGTMGNGGNENSAGLSRCRSAIGEFEWGKGMKGFRGYSTASAKEKERSKVQAERLKSE